MKILIVVVICLLVIVSVLCIISSITGNSKDKVEIVDNKQRPNDAKKKNNGTESFNISKEYAKETMKLLEAIDKINNKY